MWRWRKTRVRWKLSLGAYGATLSEEAAVFKQMFDLIIEVPLQVLVYLSISKLFTNHGETDLIRLKVGFDEQDITIFL